MPLLCFGRGGRLQGIVTELDGGVKGDVFPGKERICPDIVTGLKDRQPMSVYLASIVSLVLAALSLGPSYAHVLESLPRLTVWSRELWRDATVFHRQFEWFARIGAPVDVAAIVAAFVLAYLLYDQRATFWLVVAGAAFLAAGLAAWLALVAPANAVLATWRPGSIPSNFDVIRRRWEIGHMVVAALKLCGLVFLCMAVASSPSSEIMLVSPE